MGFTVTWKGYFGFAPARGVRKPGEERFLNGKTCFSHTQKLFFCSWCDFKVEISSAGDHSLVYKGTKSREAMKRRKSCSPNVQRDARDHQVEKCLLGMPITVVPFPDPGHQIDPLWLVQKGRLVVNQGSTNFKYPDTQEESPP